MNARFEIHRKPGNTFFFRLITGSNDEIFTGFDCQSLNDCNNSIKALRISAPRDERYERSSTSDGKWFFSLRSGTMQPIGISRNFSSSQEMEAGIFAVKNSAPQASVVVGV